MRQDSATPNPIAPATILATTPAQPIRESLMRNDRQSYFEITRELVNAQFKLADEQLSQRLWDDASERELDLERIVNLMFSCSAHQDNEAMTAADENYCKANS
ncbi:MAG: hypothetical protein AB8E74_09125 [Prochlorococcus sp.]